MTTTRSVPRSTTKTQALTAVIEGFFSFLWFGWGRADASSAVSTVYTVLGVLALVTAVLGVAAFRRAPAQTSPMADPATRRRYNIVVGVEFALCFAGAAVLGRSGQQDWIPVWVCAIVGLHFFPLSRVFPDADLPLLGAVVTAVALVALVVGLATGVAPGTVTGGGAGTALLVGAVLALTGRRLASQHESPAG